MTRRKLLVTTTGILAGLGLVGVGLVPGRAQAKGLRIGFSQVTLQSPFYVELKAGAEAAAKAGGDEIVFLDANGDVNKQNNDIQDLITRGMNVLIINPVNPDAVGPSLEAAKAASIPVITVDRDVHGTVVTYIGRDNEKMGGLVGQAVVDHFQKAGIKNPKIIEIQGDAGGTVMAARRDGFHKVAEAAGLKIVKGPYAEYIRANAVTAMQDLLQANPDVKGVYAHNDDMALGALQVLRENGRTDVVVAGVDGLSEAVKDIASGDQYIATTLNDPRYLGDVTIQTARQIVAGKKVPPFVDAGTTLVTKDNVTKFPTTALFAEYRPAIFQQ
jgi:ribose transport system substrate-binding protein